MAEIKSKLKLNFSLCSISRILRKNGLLSFVAIKLEHLSPSAMEARLKFAQDNLNIDSTQIVFTDEKTVQCFSNGPIKIRCARGEKSNPENIKYVKTQRKCKVR